MILSVMFYTFVNMYNAFQIKLLKYQISKSLYLLKTETILKLCQVHLVLIFFFLLISRNI